VSGSLRRTLLVRTGLAAALVLVLAGALLYVLFRADLQRQFDRALDDKARLLASAVTREGNGLDLEFSELDMGEFLAGEGTGYLELYGADGSVLYRSPSLGAADLPRAQADPGAPVHAAVDLPGDRDGRAVTVVFRPRPDEEEVPAADVAGEPPLTLVMARETGTLDGVVARFGGVLLAVVLVTVLVMGLTITAVIGGSLRPVASLTARLAGLDARDLSARLPETDVPDELRPVVLRLNELLARLETAFAREKAFSADAAHELRTPLAGLRANLEVALSRPREADDYRRTLEACLDTSAHLQALVENLLELARLDAGAVAPRRETVVLADALERAWSPLRQAAADRGLTLRCDDPGDAVIATDPLLLQTALRNLADNAIAYADAGGTVTCSVGGDAEAIELRIANTGCALTQAEADALGDRFRRGDRARPVDDDHHSGLGLALVRAALAVLGGEFVVRVPGDGTWQAAVRLPREARP